jgi:hypothetical protein
MTPELSLETLESHGPWQSAALKGYTDETLVMADLVDSSQRAAIHSHLGAECSLRPRRVSPL